MDIQYRFFENPVCEARVRVLVQPLRWLLPSWLNKLHINSASPEDDDGAVACTHVKPEYGLATIEVNPLFWEQPPRSQEIYILHEVLHVAHGRIHSLVQRRLLAHLKESNPDLHMFCEDEFRERTEEFIEGLTQAIAAHNEPPHEHP